MTNEEFTNEFEAAINRAKKVLVAKASEYAPNNDRLENFKCAAGAQGINPVQALVGMMTKHYVSVCEMAKNPHKFDLKKWNEKLGDLRNYVILCEALIRDIGVE